MRWREHVQDSKAASTAQAAAQLAAAALARPLHYYAANARLAEGQWQEHREVVAIPRLRIHLSMAIVLVVAGAALSERLPLDGMHHYHTHAGDDGASDCETALDHRLWLPALKLTKLAGASHQVPPMQRHRRQGGSVRQPSFLRRSEDPCPRHRLAALAVFQTLDV